MAELFSYDLDSYRQRIGFTGQLEPSLAILHRLAELHPRSIPFENIDVLMGRGINLDPEALQAKLIHGKRGGYCFEQNGMMLGILRQIGFEVTPLSGRVRLESTRDMVPPRTHLFLVVRIEDEDWIFDVGVGGFSLTTPLRRHAQGEQRTLHEPRQIVHEADKFFHQVWTGSSWLDVVEFTGEVMPEIDREVGNWWTSSSPKAKFSQRLVCARSDENGQRLFILNDRFARRRGGEILEEFTLVSADHLVDTLNGRFGMSLPQGTRIGSGDRPWPTE